MSRLAACISLLLAVLLAACGDDAPTAGADAGFREDAATPDVGPAGPQCGDGVVEGTEECDEGPLNGGPGHCSRDCRTSAAVCGDGVVQAAGGEVCDDGERNGQYGRCAGDCRGPAARCGDGLRQAEHEVCDDGDAHNGSYGRCAAGCRGPAAFCGDGHVDAQHESCDDGPANGEPGRCPRDCQPVVGCGDGVPAGEEVCDDGLANGTYGHCRADCTGPGPACGDGLVQPPEACDDGVLNGRYGHCLATCAGPGPRCGDGVVQEPEVCDDGADNGTIGRCAADCLAPASPWIASPGEFADATDPGVAGCRDDDLLGKYLRYRARFRGNGSAAEPGFIVIGPGPGESIPASRREPTVNCKGHWSFAECPHVDDPDARGKYNWGDATVWLGDYLAVLALEYALFVELGLPTAETLDDLRLALAAFDRVDERAETFYDVPPARDGFFLRDDVPDDFHLQPDGSYRWPRDDGYLGYECVSADLICDPPSVEDGSYVSQDQAIALMWGMALVAKLVPADLAVDGVSLRDDAREKVHRMVWFMRKNGWRIVDPLGESPPDAWGGNAIGFSSGMAKVANRVCGADFGVDDYRNFASQTLGEASWVGLQVIWEQTHAYNRTHALRLAAANGVWDGEKMARMALGDGKDLYPLTWALLHDATLPAPWSDWRLEALLRSAPCGGPCFGTAGCSQPFGWMSESRTCGPNSRFGSRHHRESEYNGLDYLALFSAYYLYKHGAWLRRPGRTAVVRCDDFVGIRTLAAAGAPDGTLYDPAAGCAVAERELTFCRRAWADWLEDAYRGQVTIFAGGGRWLCEPGQPCRVVHDGTTHTRGDDLILGTPGADALYGGDGNDCLVGFAGDDVLEGGQGFDELWGLAGNDRLYGESANWIVLDGEGDVLFGGDGDDLLEGNGGKDELYGEAGDDELYGGPLVDFLSGGPGHDLLEGGSGDDTLHGGDGDDRLRGDGGEDTLWGDAGRDALAGGGGPDYLDGGSGDDLLLGEDGDDVLVTGDDWETHDFGRDRACGGRGDDTIWAGWDGDACLGGGWLLGGTDSVNGCEDGSATADDCRDAAFEDW